MYLSIDWDAFIFGDFDTSHGESPFYLDHVWLARLGYPYRMSGRERTFWNRVPVDHVKKVVVTDSHAFARPHVKGDHLVVVDAHHDCWDLPKDRFYGCDSWVTHWLLCSPKRQMTWVSDHSSQYSSEVALFGDMDKRINNRVTIMDFDEFFKLVVKHPVKGLHICRSGGWSPPWFDQRFINFVNRCPVPTKKIIYPKGMDVFNPMKKRWKKPISKLMKSVAQQTKVGRFTVMCISDPLQALNVLSRTEHDLTKEPKENVTWTQS